MVLDPGREYGTGDPADEPDVREDQEREAELERAEELVLRHRRAALDVGRLSALVQLFLRELVERAVVLPRRGRRACAAGLFPARLDEGLRSTDHPGCDAGGDEASDDRRHEDTERACEVRSHGRTVPQRS